MDKQILVDAYDKILAIKRNELLIHVHERIPQKHFIEQKKPDTKKSQYDSTHTKSKTRESNLW